MDEEFSVPLEWINYLSEFPNKDGWIHDYFNKENKTAKALKIFELFEILYLPIRVVFASKCPQNPISSISKTKTFFKIIRNLAGILGINILPNLVWNENEDFQLKEAKNYSSSFLTNIWGDSMHFAIPIVYRFGNGEPDHFNSIVISRNKKKKAGYKVVCELFEPKGYDGRCIEFYKRIDSFVRGLFFDCEEQHQFLFSFSLKLPSLGVLISLQDLFQTSAYENCSHVLCLWYIILRLTNVYECQEASALRMWFVFTQSADKMQRMESIILFFLQYSP